ncbi:hypothetical protein [Lysobacter sp. CA199]|uniref:hypothetical protein n=1 Tax=Lysobacter sp. CA199 TaxID=3455608 RepID=UPI003F8D5FE9
MLALKPVLLGLVCATAAFSAVPATASSFEVWNGSGWSNNGTSHLIGPVNFSYLNSFPCTADLTVTVSNGVAKVTNVQFSGSQLCAAIAGQLLPWSVTASPAPYAGANPPFAGAPLLTPVLRDVSFDGVRIRLPAPLSTNCPVTPATGGSIAGVLDSTDQFNAPPALPVSNRLVFRANLPPCAIQTRSSPPPGGLAATPALRIVP